MDAAPGEAQASAVAGSAAKEVLLRERMAARRLERIRVCTDGQCSIHRREAADPTGPREPAMPCRGGCGRSLHGGPCADMERGHILLARFTCHHCRLRLMGAEGDPLVPMLDNVTRSALLDLTTGRSGTAAGYERFVRLSELYLEFMHSQGLVRVLKPQDSLESFRAWCNWMIIDEKRVREFIPATRQAAGFLKGTNRPPYVSDPSIKALIAEIEDVVGTPEQPTTVGTCRLLTHMYHDVIPRLRGHAPLIKCRDQLNLVNTAVGALRVGESCNGLEGHGLLANNSFIIRDANTNETSVEYYLQDSKTHSPRWVNLAGHTRGSNIDVVSTLREHWRLSGLHVTPPILTGGFLVEQPDSWAVKLSLLALPEDWFSRFSRVMHCLAEEHMYYAKVQATLKRYARERKEGRSHTEAHRYVLLSEGRHADPLHRTIMLRLQAEGLGTIGASINLVPAPLIRATTAAGRILTPMPFMADSTYTHLNEAFTEALKMANPPGDPDPEFDLQGHSNPRLGHHSWRRYADKVARDNMNLHPDLTKEDLNLFAGWKLKELLKDMQIKYAGQQRSHRVKRARLTVMA